MDPAGSATGAADGERPSGQLTLGDWERMLRAASDREPPPASPTDADPVDLGIVRLVEELAPRIADELVARIPPGTIPAPPTRQLLTLDELVAELPPAKPAKTWKRWLYERTRRGEVPGEVKLGGMLFFEREPALAWLRNGALTR